MKSLVFLQMYADCLFLKLTPSSLVKAWGFLSIPQRFRVWKRGLSVRTSNIFISIYKTKKHPSSMSRSDIRFKHSVKSFPPESEETHLHPCEGGPTINLIVSDGWKAGEVC